MKALVNYEVAEAFERETGIETIAIKPYSHLDSPVAAHPDMLFCILDKTVFCYGDYVSENGIDKALTEHGYKIISVSNKCECKYPKDISLNVLVMGKCLFCNKKNTALEILEYADLNGYTVYDVKQGYAACSSLVIDENTAITSDESIARAIELCGKTVLRISNEQIILPGYNCGFIGGSSGKIGGRVCFFGNIDTLSDGEQIRKLLKTKNCSIIPIMSGRVYDFGGIKII